MSAALEFSCGNENVVDKPLVIRPRPWLQLPTVSYIVIGTAVISSAYATVTLTGPYQGWAFAYILILIYGLCFFEFARLKIVVTPDEIRMISTRRKRPVPRAEVAQVRAMRWDTIFYGHDTKPLLNTNLDLTRTQLLELARELGVPVWDHRGWLGLRKLEYGVRITPDPRAVTSADDRP